MFSFIEIFCMFQSCLLQICCMWDRVINVHVLCLVAVLIFVFQIVALLVKQTFMLIPLSIPKCGFIRLVNNHQVLNWTHNKSTAYNFVKTSREKLLKISINESIIFEYITSIASLFFEKSISPFATMFSKVVCKKCTNMLERADFCKCIKMLERGLEVLFSYVPDKINEITQTGWWHFLSISFNTKLIF